MQLNQRYSQKFGRIRSMPAATTRCSAEALVTARTLPCQGLEDICGGVRVDKALCLPVGLHVLAQGRAGFHNHMGARLVGGCKALWLRVHGAYHRLLPSLLKPLALPLVLEHLVEFCPTTCFDVLVRRLSGFTCQQRSTEDRQESTTVASLDAVDEDVVTIPHCVLDCWPDISPLLGAFIAVCCCFMSMWEAADLQGHCWELAHRLLDWQAGQENLAAFAGCPDTSWGLSCACTNPQSHLDGGRAGLQTAYPLSFWHLWPQRLTCSSACHLVLLWLQLLLWWRLLSSAGLGGSHRFGPLCGCASPQLPRRQWRCRQPSSWRTVPCHPRLQAPKLQKASVTGAGVAAITALLIRQMPAPCFPPQARPDCWRMACAPKGQSGVGALVRLKVWAGKFPILQGCSRHLASHPR